MTDQDLNLSLTPKSKVLTDNAVITGKMTLNRSAFNHKMLVVGGDTHEVCPMGIQSTLSLTVE